MCDTNRYRAGFEKARQLAASTTEQERAEMRERNRAWSQRGQERRFKLIPLLNSIQRLGATGSIAFDASNYLLYADTNLYDLSDDEWTIVTGKLDAWVKGPMSSFPDLTPLARTKKS